MTDLRRQFTDLRRQFASVRAGHQKCCLSTAFYSAWRTAIRRQPGKFLGIGGVAAHRRRCMAVQFLLAGLTLCPRPHADRGTEVPPTTDDPIAEAAPLAIVARERRVEIAPRGRDCLHEAERVERCLRHPGTDMRPRHE